MRWNTARIVSLHFLVEAEPLEMSFCSLWDRFLGNSKTWSASNCSNQALTTAASPSASSFEIAPPPGVGNALDPHRERSAPRRVPPFRQDRRPHRLLPQLLVPLLPRLSVGLPLLRVFLLRLPAGTVASGARRPRVEESGVLVQPVVEA